LNDAKVRVLKLHLLRLSHQRRHLISLFQRLSHQFASRSTGRANDQNPKPISPAARNRFGRFPLGRFSREQDRQQNCVWD